MSLTYWRCMECDATGEYVQPAGETKKKGSAAHHTNETGHATVTSLRPPRV